MIVERFPANFAAERYVGTAELDGILYFRGEPAREVESLVKSSGLRIDVRTDAMMAESDMITAQYQAKEFSSGPRASVTDDAPDPDMPSFGGAGPEVGVIVTETDDPVRPSTVIAGDATSTCTSGFVVQQGALRGILSAAHCNPPQTYLGRNVLTDRGRGTSDVRWFSSSETTAARFRVSSNSNGTRNVTGTADPPVGTYVCRYGKSTPYSCSYVETRNVCWENACTATRTTTKVATTGDSGGPWFNNFTAMGVHVADSSTASHFIPVRYAVAELSVTVLTS